MTLYMSRPPLTLSRTTILAAVLIWLASVDPALAQPTPPDAVDDAAMTSITYPVTVYVIGNDTVGTFAIDTHSVEIVTPPMWGTATVSSNGDSIIYTPTSNTYTTVTIEYAIRDVYGNPSYPATVSVQVSQDPASCQYDSATVPYNQSVAINVLQNDTYEYSPIDPTTVEITEQPTRGSVSVNGTTGVITYTPTGSNAGADSFRYRVFDEEGFPSSAATVAITVTNTPPQVTNYGSWYLGSHLVKFSGVVVDEAPVNCTVHLGMDLNVDVTPDAQGYFEHTAHMNNSYGHVSFRATDPAGQQSSPYTTCMYFCM